MSDIVDNHAVDVAADVLASDAASTNHAAMRSKLNWVKRVHSLRTYLSSLSNAEMRYFFDTVREYLIIGQNSDSRFLTLDEKDNIGKLLGHWELNNMENNSALWWSTLLYNHSDCETFYYIINEFFR